MPRAGDQSRQGFAEETSFIPVNRGRMDAAAPSKIPSRRLKRVLPPCEKRRLSEHWTLRTVSAQQRHLRGPSPRREVDSEQKALLCPLMESEAGLRPTEVLGWKDATA